MKKYTEFECLDPIETIPAKERLRRLYAKLPGVIRRVQHYGNDPRIANVNADAITKENWEQIPVVRKTDLITKQTGEQPLAGFNTTAINAFTRLFQSPGPIYTAEAFETDPWNTARALHAAGFKPGDRVMNCFSYHMSPGGFILDGGLRALECAVIPAGPGNTTQQVQIIAHLKPNGYVGTPSFLKHLIEAAETNGMPWDSLTHALVSGEALPPSLRAWFDNRDISVLQAYATADVGTIAYESSARNGLFCDDNVFVEIVAPHHNHTVPHGEIGEVVVTRFHQHYPLIRFGTGDLSAFLPDPTDLGDSVDQGCGRTATKLKGWLGRADDAVKIRGLFVHPAQINAVLQRLDPEYGIAHLAVTVTTQDGKDHLSLEYATRNEQPTPHANDLHEELGRAFKEHTKLRADAISPMPQPAKDAAQINDKRHYA